jgi:hypothetical protein
VADVIQVGAPAICSKLVVPDLLHAETRSVSNEDVCVCAAASKDNPMMTHAAAVALTGTPIPIETLRIVSSLARRFFRGAQTRYEDASERG